MVGIEKMFMTKNKRSIKKRDPGIFYIKWRAV